MCPIQSAVLPLCYTQDIPLLSCFTLRHHHHMSVMELGHLLTRSGLTYLEVSSEVVFHDSFCQFGSTVSLPRVIYFEAFYLYVVSSSSCIPVVYLEPVLFLTLLQCVSLSNTI